MLYSRRNKVRAEQQAAQAGRDLWTAKFPEPARAKLVYAVFDLVSDLGYGTSFDILATAHARTVRELGVPHLSGRQGDPANDIQGALLGSSEDTLLTVLEAVLAAAKNAADRKVPMQSWQDNDAAENIAARLPAFRELIRTILREYWLKYDLVNDQFVDVDSRELHESVVIPTLSLLGGAKGFDASEKAYMDALRELHEGEAADAITDATTALQEALVALGFKGNTVSKLINSAVEAGRLAPYDRKIGEWLEADRSNKGDAHNARPTPPEDGWLVVHVVGAMLVRLTRLDASR